MRTRKLLVLATMAMLGALAGGQCWAVDPDPDPSDMDPGVLAKMARLKHKNLDGGDSSNTVRVNGNSLGAAQCGSINVGNVIAPQQRLGQQPREINVIVTGSIVNANNKCK